MRLFYIAFVCSLWTTATIALRLTPLNPIVGKTSPYVSNCVDKSCRQSYTHWNNNAAEVTNVTRFQNGQGCDEKSGIAVYNSSLYVVPMNYFQDFVQMASDMYLVLSKYNATTGKALCAYNDSPVQSITLACKSDINNNTLTMYAASAYDVTLTPTTPVTVPGIVDACAFSPKLRYEMMYPGDVSCYRYGLITPTLADVLSVYSVKCPENLTFEQNINITVQCLSGGWTRTPSIRDCVPFCNIDKLVYDKQTYTMIPLNHTHYRVHCVDETTYVEQNDIITCSPSYAWNVVLPACTPRPVCRVTPNIRIPILDDSGNVALNTTTKVLVFANDPRTLYYPKFNTSRKILAQCSANGEVNFAYSNAENATNYLARPRIGPISAVQIATTRADFHVDAIGVSVNKHVRYYLFSATVESPDITFTTFSNVTFKLTSTGDGGYAINCTKSLNGPDGMMRTSVAHTARDFGRLLTLLCGREDLVDQTVRICHNSPLIEGNYTRHFQHNCIPCGSRLSYVESVVDAIGAMVNKNPTLDDKLLLTSTLCPADYNASGKAAVTKVLAALSLLFLTLFFILLVILLLDKCRTRKNRKKEKEKTQKAIETNRINVYTSAPTEVVQKAMDDKRKLPQKLMIRE